jgi:putative ABC transport system permease protein
MVSDGPLPVGLIGVDGDEERRAERALVAGDAVVFVAPGVDLTSGEVQLTRRTYDEETGEETGTTSTTVAAEFFTVDDRWIGPQAVVSTDAAVAVGGRPEVVALAVTGTEIGEDQEEEINEALGGINMSAGIYVERGHQAEDETVIAQLILVALGGVLMLGGTLTATFLALSDARPDLATLSAVGASPRTRRGVAAGYAVVVGFVGAVLGATVGFIPGIAVTYPLTSQGYGAPGPDGAITSPGPFLDVPWLMVLGLVVALPLLTAAVVGVFARSRLPVVARLD